MSFYETICIIKPDIGEEAIKAIIAKATTVIEVDDATVPAELVVDEWGRRRLAYPIQKSNEGHYVLFTYTATPAASKELERTFRIVEDVVRYQTVALTERKAKVVEAAPEAEAKPTATTTPAAATPATAPTAATPAEAKPTAKPTAKPEAAPEAEAAATTEKTTEEDKGGQK
jgi:small subunit ribosomal protein S6